MNAEPVRRVPRAHRERQMVEAASSVFARKGFEAATMDEIARDVGVTKPMLYAYFGSKEGLFLACTERAADRLIAALESASRVGPLDERLWTGLRALFDWLEEEPEIGRLLLGRRAPSPGTPLTDRVEGLRARIAEVNERIMREASLEHGAGPEALAYTPTHAHLLAAVTEAAAERWLDHREEPKELHVLLLMNFAWQGLGGMIRGELWFPPRGGHRAEPADAFARLVRDADDERLGAMLAAGRRPILDGIFASMAAHVDPDATRDIACTLEWRVDREDRYQLHLERGSCAVERDGGRAPDVTYRIGALDFVRVMTGNASGPELWVRGRMLIEGDAVLAARAATFFGSPQPPPSPPE